jgi:hypothetical protein
MTNRHAMLLYRDPREHGSACAQYLTADAPADAAALVAVTRPHASSLRPRQDVGWLDRPHEDLSEAIRYETLLCDALSGSAVEVLCGYDARLDSALLAAAEQAHSVVLEAGLRRAAATGQAAQAPVPAAPPLSDPPPGAEAITFRADQAAVRGFALAAGLRAGLSRSRITDRLAGTLRPDPSAPGTRRGLWLVHQVSDLVQVRSGPAGTTIRVHLRLPGRRGTG